MNTIILYRPFRSYFGFALFTLCMSILAFIMVGYYLTNIDIVILFWITVAVICIILSKILYDSFNINVLFEDEGLRISGGKYNNYHYSFWKNITYAYYARSYKGHLFLALSLEKLSSKQVKQLVNRSAILSKMCIDNVIVVYMDITQDTSQIKEFINDKLSHIEYIC